MPTPPQTISLTPASAPGAPSTITLTPASSPGAPGRILLQDTSGINITGTLTPNVAGHLLSTGTVTTSDRQVWSSNGNPTPPGSGTYDTCFFLIGVWGITRYVNNVQTAIWTSTDDVQTPDLVTTWTAGVGATGTPVVTLGPSGPSTIALSAASAPAAPSTITLTAASQPAAPGVITPS